MVRRSRCLLYTSTYQVVVNKKYLTAQQVEELSQEPIQLEPWDPMGSLA